MSGIFINYRRDDAKGEAGRLFDWLSRYFGKDQVFMDVSGSIEPGLEFDRVIETAVSSCDVLIVVIGKEWLSATDEKGRRRLADPKDFVRLEIAAALRRDIRVIPVLVQEAEMPDEEALPDDLKKLCRRQASELSDNRWEFDTEQLVKVLEKIGVKRKAGTKSDTEETIQTPATSSRKFRWKVITSLIISALLMSLFSEGTLVEDTKIGGMAFSLAALVLAIVAYYDLKLNPGARSGLWKVLSIAGMTIAGLMFFAFIGAKSELPALPVTASTTGYNTQVSVQPATPTATPTYQRQTTRAVPAAEVQVPDVVANSETNIGGTWQGQDGYYIFGQSGTYVSVSLYAMNRALLAQGSGSINGNLVKMSYVSADNTGGNVELRVSADGRQMTGSYRNAVTGEVGSVVLVR
jgi:hypothetical protein